MFEPAFDLRTAIAALVGRVSSSMPHCAAVTLASVWRLGHLPHDDPQTENSPPSNAAALSGKKYPPKENVTASDPRSSIWLDRLRWLALPACASLMLLATTNHVVPGRGGRAVPVGRSAGTLFAFVHHHVRPLAMVRSLALGDGSSGGVGWLSRQRPHTEFHDSLEPAGGANTLLGSDVLPYAWCVTESWPGSSPARGI